ncbi:unnamed protein product, partial [Mesorhabditis spiculigera]
MLKNKHSHCSSLAICAIPNIAIEPFIFRDRLTAAALGSSDAPAAQSLAAVATRHIVTTAVAFAGFR